MKSNNRGFSLIELLVVVAIMAVLTGGFLVSPAVGRKKIVDTFAHELAGQIQYSKQLSMAREGQWQMTVFEKDGEYFCVHENKKSDTWSTWSNEEFLGYSGEILCEKTFQDGISGETGGEGEIYRIYRFDKNTGRCVAGAGTFTINGYGKQIGVTVYEETGRCEITREEL